jgi:site-specific DNA-cytosine methylase
MASDQAFRFNSMDLFSGLGGNAFAFRSFADTQLYCEILPSARVILKSAMLKGHIPTAPIHNDVTTLMKNPLYQRIKNMRPLLISGSWPCQARLTCSRRGSEF